MTRLVTRLAAAVFLVGWMFVPPSGTIVKISGDGQVGAPGQFLDPLVGQVFDSSGSPVPYARVILDAQPGAAFEVPDEQSGIISTAAGGGNFGDGGPAPAAALAAIEDLGAMGSGFGSICGADGTVFIADSGHARIRRVVGGIIDTVVGNGFLGEPAEGAVGTETPIGLVKGLAFDPLGRLYFSDAFNHAVFRWDLETQEVHRVAGSGASTPGAPGDGGPALDAAVRVPAGIALDGFGNLYIAQQKDGIVRRVDAATGTISTLASGLGFLAGAAFDGVSGVCVSRQDLDVVYRIDTMTGAAMVIAGGGTGGLGDGGPATQAALQDPAGLAWDAQGNLYVAEAKGNRVRRVDGVTGIITTVAGGGPGPSTGDGGPATQAVLLEPIAIEVECGTGDLYIGTLKDGRVRRVENFSQIIGVFAGNGTATYAGDGGVASMANLKAPSDAARDAAGNAYVADAGNGRVRRVAPNGTISTVVGGGTEPLSDGLPGTEASNVFVRRLDVTPNGSVVMDVNKQVWRWDPGSGSVFLLYDGTPDVGDGDISDVSVARDGTIYVTTYTTSKTLPLPQTSAVRRLDGNGGATVVASIPEAHLSFLGTDPGGAIFWLLQSAGGSGAALRRIDPATGSVQTFAGVSGNGLACDEFGNLYYTKGNQVRYLDVLTGETTEVAGTGAASFGGDGGPALSAQLANPLGLETGSIRVADSNNDRIRSIVLGGTKLVQQIQVFADANGVFTSPSIQLGLTSGAVGISAFAPDADATDAWTVTVGFPAGGEEGPPPPIAQRDRHVTNHPAFFFPRWTPPVGIFAVPTGGGGGGGGIGGGGGGAGGGGGIVPGPDEPMDGDTPIGSHRFLAVDSRGVAHVVEAIGGTGPGGTIGIGYFNNRDATRHANGFSQGVTLSTSDPAVTGFGEPAMAVDSSDRLHVAWTERVVGGGPRSLHYRLIGQDPPSMGPDDPVFSVSSETSLGDPHISVDGEGHVHIVLNSIRDVESPGLKICEWNVLHSVDLGEPASVRHFKYMRELVGDEFVVTLTSTPEGMTDSVPFGETIVDSGPGPSAHVAWMELPVTLGNGPGVFDADTNHARVYYFGPAAVGVANVGADIQGIKTFDLAVDGSNVPHLLFGADQVWYRKGTGGTKEQVNDAPAFVGFRDHVLLRVDSRGRPHAAWTFGYARRDEELTPAWSRQEMGSEVAVGELGVSKVFSLALDRQDNPHVMLGGGYTRAVVNDLGDQDAFLMADAGPNARANLGNGNLVYTLPVFSSRGVGFATSLSLVYNSLDNGVTTMAPGWGTNYDLRVLDPTATPQYVPIVSLDVGVTTQPCVSPFQVPTFNVVGLGALRVRVRLGDGRQVDFELQGEEESLAGDGLVAAFLPRPEFGYSARLERSPADTSLPPEHYTLLTKTGIRYRFDARGRLAEIRDTQPDANTMAFLYEDNPQSDGTGMLLAGEPDSTLSTIVDSAGRQTHLTFDSRSRFAQAQDPGTKTYTVEYGEAGRPSKVHFPLGVTWSFAHSAANAPTQFERFGFLRTIQTPRGTDEIFAWTLQVHRDGRWAATIEPGETYIEEETLDGTESVEAARVCYYEDPVPPEPGGTVSEADYPVAHLFNRRGFETLVRHEPRRNLALRVTDPLGHFLLRGFSGSPGAPDGFRNLESFQDKRGFVTSYTYFPAGGVNPFAIDNVETIHRPGTSQPIQYTYKPLSRVETVTDALGNATSYDYDGAGNLVLIAYPPAPVVTVTPGVVPPDPDTAPSVAAHETFAYDSRGRTTSHTSPNGGITTFQYGDAATGLVTSILRPEHAASESFGYDGMGNTVGHTMPEGGTSTFVLDDLYRVAEQHDPPAAQPADPPTDPGLVLAPDSTTKFFYNLDSQIDHTIDPAGQVTHNGYNKLGWQTSTTNAEGNSMSFRHDREGNTRNATDFNGNDSFTTYDALGRVRHEIRPGPPQVERDLGYDENGNLVADVEGSVPSGLAQQIADGGSPALPPGARLTRREYDVRNNVTQVTQSIASIEDESSYDDNDRLTGSKRTEGGTFQSGAVNFYDARSRLRATVQAADGAQFAALLAGGTVTGTLVRTAFGYDLDGNRTVTEDAEGSTTGSVYDLADRATTSVDAAGEPVAHRVYNDNDLVTTSFARAPQGVTGVTLPGLGDDWLVVATTTYNLRNQPVVTEDAAGNTRRSYFDVRGQMVGSRDALGGLSVMIPDALGRVTLTTQHVDSFGISTVTTDPSFDPNGNRDQIVDPRGKTYLFTQDQSNRMTSMATPLGFVESWTYTDHGEMLTHLDANGRLTENTYDALGRLLRELHTLSGEPISDVHRRYNGAGSLVRIWDAVTHILIVRKYDGLQRMVEEQTRLEAANIDDPEDGGGTPGVFWYRVRYAYNAAGDRIAMLVSADLGDGAGEQNLLAHRFEYDVNHRLAGIFANGVPTFEYPPDADPIFITVADGEEFVHFDRDDVGRQTQITYKGGVHGEWAYNALEQVVSIVWKNPQEEVLASFFYSYDANGDRVGVTQGHINSTMTAEQYATLQWLAEEHWEGDMNYEGLYRYDAAGNRIFCQRTFTGSSLTGAVGIPLPGFEGWATQVTAHYTIDDDNRLIEENRTFTGTPPGTEDEFLGFQLIGGGTAIADSSQGGFTSARLNDDGTADSPTPANAWKSANTAVQHFAGVQYPDPHLFGKVDVYLPTLGGGGNNAASGMRRFKVQVFNGMWSDVEVTSVTGAEPAPGFPGWLRTTSPTPHVVTIEFGFVAGSAIRVVMDANGGPQGTSKQMALNEVDPYEALFEPGTPASVPVLILYESDGAGNLITRTTQDQNGGVISTEHFGYGPGTQVESYLRQDGQGTLEAHWQYLFDPLRRRVAKVDLVASEGEWFAYRDGDVVADFANQQPTFFQVARTYLQSFDIDAKFGSVGPSENSAFYLRDGRGTSVGIVSNASLGVASQVQTSWGELLQAAPSLSCRYMGLAQRESEFESNLVYMRSRSYDCTLGRLGAPESDHRFRVRWPYPYGLNRPHAYADPTGALVVSFSAQFVDPTSASEQVRSGSYRGFGRTDRVFGNPPYNLELSLFTGFYVVDQADYSLDVRVLSVLPGILEIRHPAYSVGSGALGGFLGYRWGALAGAALGGRIGGTVGGVNGAIAGTIIGATAGYIATRQHFEVSPTAAAHVARHEWKRVRASIAYFHVLYDAEENVISTVAEPTAQEAGSAASRLLDVGIQDYFRFTAAADRELETVETPLDQEGSGYLSAGEMVAPAEYPAAAYVSWLGSNGGRPNDIPGVAFANFAVYNGRARGEVVGVAEEFNAFQSQFLEALRSRGLAP